MKIILKYLVKSIAEKRFRTFLIVLSIALSVALFFASNAFSQTFSQMIVERYKQFFGSSELVIWSNEQSPHWLFSSVKAEELKDKTEYIIGSLTAEATYSPERGKSEQLSIRAFELEDLKRFSNLHIVSEKDLLPFKGSKLIINTTFAEKHGLKVGDTLEIKLNGLKYKMKIAAIVLPQGIYKSEPRQATVIMPLKKLARIYEAYDRVSMLFLKTKAGVEVAALQEELKGRYKRYTVQEPVNRAELMQQLQGFTVVLQIMTILILCMSIFIIYSSFKVITMERLPIIGTFRSVGATRATTDLILLLESVVYGIIGGLVGILLGFGVLYIMSQVLSYDVATGVKELDVTLSFSAGHIAGAFILALGLSAVSSLLPIIKISKIPIKEIVLNKLESGVKSRKIGSYIGLIVILAALVIPFISRRLEMSAVTVLFSAGAMILMLVGLIMAVPLFTGVIIRLVEQLYIYIFGNVGVIAAKNIRDNQSILNNISLLSIGIASILMINIVSYSIGVDMGRFYHSARFDVWMWTDQADRSLELLLSRMEGVKLAKGMLEAGNVEVSGTLSGTDYRLATLNGTDGTMLDFWDIDLKPEELEQLDEGRYILLNMASKEALKVEMGDVIVLKMAGKKERNYKVTGFFKSNRPQGGHGIISERYFKVDMRMRNYNNFMVKSEEGQDSEELVAMMKKKLKRRDPWVETISQMRINDEKNAAQVLSILKGFSMLTMLIGVFGVLNNLIISFIQRKRSLAMYRSIGMSRGQIVKMIFIESFTGGLVGGIAGSLTGLFFCLIVDILGQSPMIGINIYISPRLSIIAALAGVAITVIASISPAINSSKMKIIEAIKYE